MLVARYILLLICQVDHAKVALKKSSDAGGADIELASSDSEGSSCGLIGETPLARSGLVTSNVVAASSGAAAAIGSAAASGPVSAPKPIRLEDYTVPFRYYVFEESFMVGSLSGCLLR
jgi:hypothetical protein